MIAGGVIDMSRKIEKNTRVPAVPLIVNDPYFSIWSPADRLNESDTENWTGHKNKLMGYVEVDEKRYLFMGSNQSIPKIEQVHLEITPTQTHYIFRNDQIELQVSFISHLLLNNLESISEPFTYLVCKVKSQDGQKHHVKIMIEADNQICYWGEEPQRMIADQVTTEENQICWMGKAKQSPLNSSGDLITIDWGYLYVATASGAGESVTPKFDETLQHCLGIELILDFDEVLEEKEMFAIFAYDDLLSIMYFGQAKKGYWARKGRTIFDLIKDATTHYQQYIKECNEFDREIMEKSHEIGDTEYQLICSLSYRQAISAHKLIVDDDNQVIFLSKECSSNGCIGTVDVSYPSIPLFLLYNSELVKGMLRPIFKFASLPVWNFEFAPHDVGRYPYACGQVYGLKEKNGEQNGCALQEGDIQPMFFEYPKEKDIFELKQQMPIEECGNMIIMTSLVHLFDRDLDFIKENKAILKQWADYLVHHSGQPGNQLCTDDFAGHLENNANLAVKGIVAIRLFSELLKNLGEGEEAGVYKNVAHEMAKQWEEKAKIANHTKLTFDGGGWSLKYNLVWDYLLGLGLFSEDLFQKEVEHYKQQMNLYGVPLDSRKTYTKSDWIVWVATMTDNKEDFKALIAPLHKYITETSNRVPFSDWYDTLDAKVMNFKNRTVQGAMFLPFLKEQLNNKGLNAHVPKH